MSSLTHLLQRANAPVVFWHDEEGGPPTLAVVDVDWLDRVWNAAVNDGGHVEPGWTDAGREAQFMPHTHFEPGDLHAMDVDHVARLRALLEDAPQ